MVIYYNDKPVFISEDELSFENQPDRLMIRSGKDDINTALDKLNSEYNSLVITGSSVKDILSGIRSSVKVIIAAGGVVERENNDVLVIKRNYKWDLPKGKLEKGESVEEGARREIEEECGIQVRIVEHLRSTYHFYDHKGERILKETLWFSAVLLSDKDLAPQQEEGITEIRWISRKDLPEIYANTYSNIRDVLEYYFSEVSGN